MKPLLAFPKADHYAFFFEEVHLLLVSWERDDKKELYRISEQFGEEALHLDYPGQLYTERVMDLVLRIFFITVREEHSEKKEKKYTLGAYFVKDGQGYAVYYEREASVRSELVFFRVAEGDEGFGLEAIEDEAEHAAIVKEIEARYGGFLQIH